jgi:hypothetical protein
MYINVFNDSRFLLCDKTHRKKIEKVIHFSGEERGKSGFGYPDLRAK